MRQTWAQLIKYSPGTRQSCVGSGHTRVIDRGLSKEEHRTECGHTQCSEPGSAQESGELWALGLEEGVGAEEPISEGAPKGLGSLVVGVMRMIEALAERWAWATQREA